MTAQQADLLIDKLDSIIYLLNQGNSFMLFTIGCAAAIIVLIILWFILKSFFSKF